MNFISEDKKTITLPVPLGTIVYNFHTTCNDACTFQKEKFDKVLPKEKFGRCKGELPCHTKLHSIMSVELTLSNLEWILGNWHITYFETEKAAREAGLKTIEEHKKKLIELGLKVEYHWKDDNKNTCISCGNATHDSTTNVCDKCASEYKF
jgi:hypothetical protein